MKTTTSLVCFIRLVAALAATGFLGLSMRPRDRWARGRGGGRHTHSLAPSGCRSVPRDRTGGGLGRKRRVGINSLARSVMVAAIAVAAFALPAITRAGPAFAEFDGTADPQLALDYWTPARMLAARPPALPGTDDGARVTLSPATLSEDGDRRLKNRTDYVKRRQVAQHPHTSIGKVFFTLNGFDHVCSASAVTTEGHWGEGSRNLVVTAGHCVNNGHGGFASNFTFVPGYFNGNAPFGRWEAERLFTTNEWNNGFGAALGRDVGFARMREGTGEYEGLELHDVVDALNIAFTESYEEDGLDLRVDVTTGTKIASIGYGVLNWGGERPVRSSGRVVRFDTNFSPHPVGMPSEHTGGASGGPWLYNYDVERRLRRQPPRRGPGSHVDDDDDYDGDDDGGDGDDRNVIVGVNSYGYGGVDEIFSPQFDNLIHDLWAFAVAGVLAGDVGGRPGDVEADAIEAYGLAEVNVVSGTVKGTYGVSAFDNAAIHISDGSIAGVFDGVYAAGSASVEILGGRITAEEEIGVDALGEATVSIAGGQISGDVGVAADEFAVIEILGGAIHGDSVDLMTLGPDAMIRVVGNHFSARPGPLTALTGEFSGQFADGAAFHFTFDRTAGGTILLVPEPSTLVLCMLGLVVLGGHAARKR